MPKASTSTNKSAILEVRGASVNNLKNISVDIPLNSFVVVTGVSGSGKSSLVFGAIGAEAERRYLTAFSGAARQALEATEKPNIEAIRHLPPVMSLSQSNVARSPRSTVGTLTDSLDYLRALYARFATVQCPDCHVPVTERSISDIVTEIMGRSAKEEMMVLGLSAEWVDQAPVRTLQTLREQGYQRIVVAGRVIHISQYTKGTIEGVIIDYIIPNGKQVDKERVYDSVRTALAMGSGIFYLQTVATPAKREEKRIGFFCSSCHREFQPITPKYFSFNHPLGSCTRCKGLGKEYVCDESKVVPNPKLSLAEGAIRPWRKLHLERSTQHGSMEYVRQWCLTHKLDLRTPWAKLPKKLKEQFLNGTDDFEGVYKIVLTRYYESTAERERSDLEECLVQSVCSVCQGSRLGDIARSATWQGIALPALLDMDFTTLQSTLEGLLKKVSSNEQLLVKEVLLRLKSSIRLGLPYLSLSRSAPTLSGGELRRLRLATETVAGLYGVLYLLDEPSTGLHSRDTENLLKTLVELQAQGNSVIVVEHDEMIMQAADYLVDIGPGAGVDGGEVLFAGDQKALKKSKTVTTKHINKVEQVAMIPKVYPKVGKAIALTGVTEKNLKDIDVKFPLGQMIAVTGVSGSGKSTLIYDVLTAALRQKLHRYEGEVGEYKKITGLEQVNKVIAVDQDPIGRSARSTVATYTGVHDFIREVFASVPEAVKASVTPAEFSFNLRGGRCEECQGSGLQQIEMFLLADQSTPCPVCEGKRYRKETLKYLYRGKDISEVLALSISEARAFFWDHAALDNLLGVLEEVGLGYLKLAQTAPQLSGGEAQRVKLATELARKGNEKTVYILDEPTTGLHFEDIKRLLLVLRRLVDRGGTVIVVEHNMDIIASADYAIEIGPNAGHAGGEVVFAGTPKDLSKHKTAPTAPFLKPYFK
jgi:excinuclease ABC subunit A